MLNPKTNVCKLRNGVLLSYLHVFKMAAKIIQDLTCTLLLIHAPRNIGGGWGFCVGLCFIMHLFVIFLFLLTL